jgi:hypothetical protein
MTNQKDVKVRKAKEKMYEEAGITKESSSNQLCEKEI